MKKLALLLVSMLTLFSATAQKKNFTYKFYGFVRGDLFYNTRANMAPVDGNFYLFPLDEKPDADGKDLKVKDWTDDQAAKIREIIGAEYKVEGDLRSEVQLNIKRLMDIGCYRGVRHRIGLPVRGQSTKNNARTRKGRKKTVANKKKATK